MTVVKRGVCSVCGQDGALTIKGLVRLHPSGKYARRRCPGSHLPPAATEGEP